MEDLGNESEEDEGEDEGENEKISKPSKRANKRKAEIVEKVIAAKKKRGRKEKPKQSRDDFTKIVKQNLAMDTVNDMQFENLVSSRKSVFANSDDESNTPGKKTPR